MNIPHSREELEVEKIICRDMSQRSNFALDENGRFILDTIFYFRPNDDSINMPFLLGLLNSDLIDFYVRQTSPPLRNGYYRFKTRYLKPLPVKFDSEIESKVVSLVERIREHIEKENKIRKFPKRYADGIDGNVEYIDYEWQTRRYPVNADIQELADGRFAVTAGRSDEITDPMIDQGDREEQKLRAKYVHEAVDGKKVKSGEKISIPIPQREEGVAALLANLETDKETVEETDIEELEAEIDDIVYNLFDLTEDEREIVENYLDVF